MHTEQPIAVIARQAMGLYETNFEGVFGALRERGGTFVSRSGLQGHYRHDFRNLGSPSPQALFSGINVAKPCTNEAQMVVYYKGWGFRHKHVDQSDVIMSLSRIMYLGSFPLEFM